MARILVADDEEDLRKLIELVLTRDGHHVVTVADGMAAVEMHQHEVFDLIVSDLQMPRLNGIQVTEKVRANPRGEIPILLITGSATEEDRVQALRAGISGLMVKPFKAADLRNRVSGLLLRFPPDGRGNDNEDRNAGEAEEVH